MQIKGLTVEVLGKLLDNGEEAKSPRANSYTVTVQLGEKTFSADFRGDHDGYMAALLIKSVLKYIAKI